MTGGSTGWNDGETSKAEVVDLAKFVPGFSLRRVDRSKKSPSSVSDSDELEKSSVSSVSNPDGVFEVPMPGVVSFSSLLKRNSSSSSSSRLNFPAVLEETLSDWVASFFNMDARVDSFTFIPSVEEPPRTGTSSSLFTSRGRRELAPAVFPRTSGRVVLENISNKVVLLLDLVVDWGPLFVLLSFFVVFGVVIEDGDQSLPVLTPITSSPFVVVLTKGVEGKYSGVVQGKRLQG